jgi:glycosyltransferase involved in cell wall biosynthesis
VNVLFLDQFSELGGAQRVLLDTASASQARGWKVRVALPGSGPLVEKLRSRGIAVTEIACGPYRSASKSVADLFRFGSDLGRQRRVIAGLTKDADLIYVNGPRLLPAAALVSRGRIPVLFHAHHHVSQGLALRLAGGSIRRAGATVIACSQSVLDSYREYCDHGAVVPNGVSEIEFRQRDHIRRIGVVGQINPHKGQAEFVRAAEILHAEFPDVRFVIRGAPLFPDSSYLRFVQKQAQGLPIDFPGWSDDTAGIMNDLDLLVVPSRSEGMGRVVIEAFSAGVPVVAYGVGGIPEVITDGESGFLVREITPEALARQLRDVMRSDPTALQRIAANARRSWEHNYSVTLYQQRITQLMECLARRSKSETAAQLQHT